MKLVISAVSKLPIYEQMENQIREQVLSGELAPGTMLPSIRALARECQVGVITSKRAYEDLCAEGILVSHPGKGVFVAEINPDYAKQKRMEQLKEQLSDVWEFAKGAGITAEEVVQMLNKLIKE
ncbi:MAG: GntR family transcriptional regulator [Lachnospiraceae bacterium]|nr:GntR family transcriptional regulator [Lachnospiraceae bacterium]